MAYNIGVRHINETDALYVILRSRANRTQVIRTSDGALVTETAANRSLYDVALSVEAAGTGYYVGTFPTDTPAGWYIVEPFIRAGATAASTDLPRRGYQAYWTGTTVTAAEPSTTAFQYTCVELYAQVAHDLGLSNLSTSGTTALRNAGQHALDHIWMHEKWSWRLRRTDVSVSTTTVYYALPEDFDALGQWDWYRKDSNGVAHHVVAVPRREYWDRYAGDADEPGYFRVAWNDTDHRYRIEFAPEPDGDYEYPDIPYYASTPLLAYTGESISTPQIPTEFHRLWYRAWLYYGAKAFSRQEEAAGYKEELDEGLSDAKAHHDEDFAKTTQMGPQNFYHDENALV